MISKSKDLTLTNASIEKKRTLYPSRSNFSTIYWPENPVPPVNKTPRQRADAFSSEALALKHEDVDFVGFMSEKNQTGGDRRR